MSTIEDFIPAAIIIIVIVYILCTNVLAAIYNLRSTRQQTRNQLRARGKSLPVSDLYQDIDIEQYKDILLGPKKKAINNKRNHKAINNKRNHNDKIDNIYDIHNNIHNSVNNTIDIMCDDMNHAMSNIDNIISNTVNSIDVNISNTLNNINKEMNDLMSTAATDIITSTNDKNNIDNNKDDKMKNNVDSTKNADNEDMDDVDMHNINYRIKVINNSIRMSTKHIQHKYFKRHIHDLIKISNDIYDFCTEHNIDAKSFINNEHTRTLELVKEYVSLNNIKYHSKNIEMMQEIASLLSDMEKVYKIVYCKFADNYLLNADATIKVNKMLTNEQIQYYKP